MANGSPFTRFEVPVIYEFKLGTGGNCVHGW